MPSRLEQAVDRREVGAELPLADRLEHLDRRDLACSCPRARGSPARGSRTSSPAVRSRASSACAREIVSPVTLQPTPSPRTGRSRPSRSRSRARGRRARAAGARRCAGTCARCASSSGSSGALEDRARVGHRLVEHQREEVVAEVVVVGDVAARAQQPVARGSAAGARRAPGAARAWRCGRGARRSAAGARTARPGRPRPTRRPCTTRRGRASRASRGGGRARGRGCAAPTAAPVPNAPARAVGQRHLERPALEVLERALEERHRDPVERRDRARPRLAPRASRSATLIAQRPLARARTAACGGTARASGRAQRLPVDQRDHLQRHAAGSGRAAGRASAFVSSLPAAVQDGGERPRAVVVTHVDARPHLVARLRERVLVASGRARRTARRAAACGARSAAPGRGAPPAGARRTCCSARRPCTRASRRRVAPEEADRVEDVAEHPRLREHQHALDRSGSATKSSTACLSGRLAVEVVAVAERDDVPPVVRRRARAAARARAARRGRAARYETG